MNELVKEYQCPGCVCGPDGENYSCYQKANDTATCTKHGTGTSFMNPGVGIVRFALGLPTGFCRTGDNPQPVYVFDKWADCKWFDDDNIYNIPTWFHINEVGHTLIRAYQPRTNKGYTLVIGENAKDMLPDSCIEITQCDIEKMD